MAKPHVLPLLAAQLLLPHWPSAIAATPASTLLLAWGFGLGWGIAIIMFGLGISRAGLSLGFAVVSGINTAAGSLIPLVRRWAEVPATTRALTLLGICLSVIGVVVCTKAGHLRSKFIAGHRNTRRAAEGCLAARPPFSSGLIYCVLCGLFSSFANLGFDFAEPLAQQCIRVGGHPAISNLGRWLSVYWGGYLPVLVIFGVKMIRNRTWENFSGPGSVRDLLLTSVMALAQLLAHLTYAMGVHYLGAMGTSVDPGDI